MTDRVSVLISNDPVALLQFGMLTDELTRRNMGMFAADVMPHLP